MAFLTIVGRFLFRHFHRKPGVVESCALAMGIFFFLTPGFGVQYTVWLLPLALVVAPVWGTVFNVGMSAFLWDAFRRGQVNDMNVLNPDVSVSLFSLLGFASVVGFLISSLARALRPGGTNDGG